MNCPVQTEQNNAFLVLLDTKSNRRKFKSLRPRETATACKSHLIITHTHTLHVHTQIHYLVEQASDVRGTAQIIVAATHGQLDKMLDARKRSIHRFAQQQNQARIG